MREGDAVYLDFSTYADMGGSASEAAFPRLEHLARARVDRYTHNRVRAMAAVPQAVKWCMADLINAMDRTDAAQLASSAPLSGFSNDGYSESYAAPMTAETLEEGLYAIISGCLAAERDDEGTPLLYLGVGA